MYSVQLPPHLSQSPPLSGDAMSPINMSGIQRSVVVGKEFPQLNLYEILLITNMTLALTLALLHVQ